MNDPKGSVAEVTCPTFEAMRQIPAFHRTYYLLLLLLLFIIIISSCTRPTSYYYTTTIMLLILLLLCLSLILGYFCFVVLNCFLIALLFLNVGLSHR